MLSWIRKQAGNPWVKALMIGVAVSFFGGFGLLSSTRVQSCLGVETQEGNVLAMVDEISLMERDFWLREKRSYQDRLYWLSKQFPDYPSPETLIDRDQLRREVMKRMVREVLVLKEADRMGIMVSDREVQEQIALLFRRGRQGDFNVDSYRATLRAQGINEKDFEEMVRRNLRFTKVEESVKSGVMLLPEEVEERYAFDHEKVKLEYVVLDPAIVAQEVLPADSVVEEYYKTNESDYYLGETRRVEYISWAGDEILPRVSVTSDEIIEFYEGAKDRYLIQPEQRMVQHIMIRVAADAPETDIEAARALIEKVHEMTLQPDADFGELAKKYSEDASKDRGGDLGWFAKGEIARMFNLQALMPELDEVAFILETGKVSEPVQTDFGFHLLRVSEKKEAEYIPLDHVREEVKEMIKHGKAMELARSNAEKLKADVEEGKTFPDAAASAGKEIMLSEWFQASDDEIFKMTDSKAIVDAVFDLESGRLSQPLEGMDHVYLVRVVEIKPERQGSIEEVRERIISILKPGVELETTIERAQNYLERINSQETNLEKIAKEINTEVKLTEHMERKEVMLEGMVYSNTLQQEVAGINMDNPWIEDPLIINNKVVIMHLLETMPPDMSKFEEEKDEYQFQLLAKKQNEIVEAWMEKLGKGRITYLDRWKDIAPDKE